MKQILIPKVSPCSHMYKFQELLEFESDGVMQMQNTAYLYMLNEIKAIDKNHQHIQILFSGSVMYVVRN